MDVSKQFEIIKYSDGETKRVTDSVVVEYSLTVFLNGQELVTTLCTPKSLESLAIGFLFSEDIIENVGQIENISISEEKRTALVTLCKERTAYFEDRKTDVYADGKSPDSISADNMRKIHTSIMIDPDKVLKLIKHFNKKSEVFLKTGGVHSCALCNQDEIIFFEEDIGRHNALDKILGKALQIKTRLDDKMILTSCRISSQIMKKAVKTGIPFVVSRSAPIDAAIELAKKYGITLIGFARGYRMNIYTHPNRIAEHSFSKGNSDD